MNNKKIYFCVSCANVVEKSIFCDYCFSQLTEDQKIGFINQINYEKETRFLRARVRSVSYKNSWDNLNSALREFDEAVRKIKDELEKNNDA